MLFATFQSTEVVEQLKSKGVFTLEEYHPFCNGNGVPPTDIEEQVGFKPIFVFPLRDKADFLTRCHMEYPSCPQQMIIFKSNEYQQVGHLGWFRTLKKASQEVFKDISDLSEDLEDGGSATYTDYLSFNKKGIYNEYIVPKIELKNVKKIVSVSDNINVLADFGVTVSENFCDFVVSDKCMKVLDKYIKGEKVRFIPPVDVSLTLCDNLTKHLRNIRNQPERVTESYVLDTYSLIRNNCVR
jgi:hypothetical protein